MGPAPVLWFTLRAASASVRRGLPLAPEFVSAPLAGSRWIVFSSEAPALAPASCEAARCGRSTVATATALKVAPMACRLFIIRASIRRRATGMPLGQPRARLLLFGRSAAPGCERRSGSIERVHQAVGEGDRRSSRGAGAMSLRRPPRLFDLADERARLLERRGSAGGSAAAGAWGGGR